MTPANSEEKIMTPENQTNSHDGSSPGAMTAGSWTILIVLLLLLAATLWIAVLGWSSGSGADVPASGYDALALGVLFSLAVGLGLMGLVFYSSRGGYDEPPSLLPAEKPDENESVGPEMGAMTAVLSVTTASAMRKQSAAKERE
ncbi:hypothetical protein [Bradyrhizobium sp. CCBAU 53338]|uniref:hypothetical protein n=1 Tax=Bradyrhizobium sp. CCBAU 53338 TaxID=1325111 RepID=UPI001FEEAC39|nr:hypothetical protein [Bradyrhizobium sp. CCBAU 53338]